MQTNVDYELNLSSTQIIVHSIEFHGTIKVAGDSNPLLNLTTDRDEANSRYKGTFLNVIVDEECSLLKKVAITAEGPNGSSMDLTATLCENKTLQNEPLGFDDQDGSLTDIFLNINLV